MDAITALSYLFEGTLHDNLRKIIPFHEIIQNSSIQHEIGVVSLLTAPPTQCSSFAV